MRPPVLSLIGLVVPPGYLLASCFYATCNRKGVPMLSRLRRPLSTGLMMALLALAWAVPTWAETTLKVIPQASLRVLDPIWTTAYLAQPRVHGL